MQSLSASRPKPPFDLAARFSRAVVQLPYIILATGIIDSLSYRIYYQTAYSSPRRLTYFVSVPTLFPSTDNNATWRAGMSDSLEQIMDLVNAILEQSLLTSRMILTCPDDTRIIARRRVTLTRRRMLGAFRTFPIPLHLARITLSTALSRHASTELARARSTAPADPNSERKAISPTQSLEYLANGDVRF